MINGHFSHKFSFLSKCVMVYIKAIGFVCSFISWYIKDKIYLM